MSHVAFAFVLALALAFFSYNAQRLVRYLRIGTDENRLHDVSATSCGISSRSGSGSARSSAIRWPARCTRWSSGASWCCRSGALEILVGGVFPAFHYASILPAPLYWLFLVSQELTAGAVLAAVAVLLYRRIVIKPRRLQGDGVHSGDAIFILVADRRADGHAAR